MRIARIRIALAGFALLSGFAGAARAQSPDTMMPEQNEAKAKQMLQQAIQALGGPAYLGVKDFTCTGHVAGIAHNGESTGEAKFEAQGKLPDKDLTEFVTKTPYTDVFLFEVHSTGKSIVAHNGDKGWTIDGNGVQDSPADVLAEYKQDHNRTINVILRQRLNEPGLRFRWTGSEIIDLHRVEWVEIDDSDHNTLRIALDEQTHLPSRLVYETLDPTTRERSEETETFSNYHSIQGVVTPLQRARERNGLKFSQIFYDECRYNTGLADSMFTRESLTAQFAKLARGKKPN